MPYKSLAQERFFHSAGAKKAGIKPSVVKEFDRATKGKKLPMRVSKKSKVRNHVKEATDMLGRGMRGEKK